MVDCGFESCDSKKKIIKFFGDMKVTRGKFGHSLLQTVHV